MNKKILNNLLLHIVLISCAILSVIWFVVFIKNSAPTDQIFHISRLDGLDNFFQSPVNFKTFHNSGKIVNIMYPPITLLPTIITKLFTSDVYVRYVFAWIYVSLISTYIGYFSLYKMTKNKFVSLLFAILVTFSVSKFNYMYEHGAISNVLALGFVPLIILGFKELVFNNYKKFYILAIAISLISLTHILTTLIVVIFLIVAYLISFLFKKFELKRFKYQIYFFLLFVLLSLLIIVPIIEQYKEYNLSSANIIWNIHGMNLWRYIVLSFNNENYLGLFNLFAYIICIVFSFKFSKFDLTIFITTIILTIFVLDFIPWNVLRYTFLVQLQYPTPRITSIINILIYYLLIKLVLQLLQNYKIKNIYLVTAAIFISLIYIFLAFDLGFKSYDRAFHAPKVNNKKIEKLFTNSKLIYSDKLQQNFFDNADYTNVGYKKYTTDLKTFFTINDKVITKGLNINENEVEVKIKPNSNEKVLITPISIYKGLEITNNNVKVEPKFSKYKTLKISLQPNKFNNIKIKYNWTILSRISQLISVCSWIGLIIYIYKRNEKRSI